MIKTVNLKANEVTEINITGGIYCTIENRGNSIVYASQLPNIQPDAEGTTAISSGNTKILDNVTEYKCIENTYDYYGKIYLFSDTDSKVELRTVNFFQNENTVKGGGQVQEDIYSKSQINDLISEKIDKNHIKIFVDSENGNDGNDGVTNPFRSIEKAFQTAGNYLSATINLASGSYFIPNDKITFVNKVVTISGAGYSESGSLVKGCICAVKSYISLSHINIYYDGTEEEALLKVTQSSTVRVESSIIQTASENCIETDTGSSISIVDTELHALDDTTQYTLKISGIDSIAYIRGVTTNIPNGIYADNSIIRFIGQCIGGHVEGNTIFYIGKSDTSKIYSDIPVNVNGEIRYESNDTYIALSEEEISTEGMSNEDKLYLVDTKEYFTFYNGVWY